MKRGNNKVGPHTRSQNCCQWVNNVTKLWVRLHPDLVPVPWHCVLALKGMLFRHCGTQDHVHFSFQFAVVFYVQLLCSFIICCSCSCSSLLVAIPLIGFCTIFLLYASIRAIVSSVCPFRARHLVTATTSNHRETWVKSMARTDEILCRQVPTGARVRCLNTTFIECPYPGTMLKFLYGHHWNATFTLVPVPKHWTWAPSLNEA